MTPSELRRLAEEYVEAQQELIDTGKINAKRLYKVSADYQAALTPEVVIALCNVAEEMKAVLSEPQIFQSPCIVKFPRITTALKALQAAFTPAE